MNQIKSMAAGLTGAAMGIALIACVAMSQEPIDEPTPTPTVTEQPIKATVVTEQPTEVPMPEELPLETNDQPEYPTEGMPDDFNPETDSTAPIQAPYEGQWDEVPDYVLACGERAKPAIDYNEVWGWWAYCEPALVEP